MQTEHTKATSALLLDARLDLADPPALHLDALRDDLLLEALVDDLLLRLELLVELVLVRGDEVLALVVKSLLPVLLLRVEALDELLLGGDEHARVLARLLLERLLELVRLGLLDALEARGELLDVGLRGEIGRASCRERVS